MANATYDTLRVATGNTINEVLRQRPKSASARRTSFSPPRPSSPRGPADNQSRIHRLQTMMDRARGKFAPDIGRGQYGTNVNSRMKRVAQLRKDLKTMEHFVLHGRGQEVPHDPYYSTAQIGGYPLRMGQAQFVPPTTEPPIDTQGLSPWGASTMKGIEFDPIHATGWEQSPSMRNDDGDHISRAIQAAASKEEEEEAVYISKGHAREVLPTHGGGARKYDASIENKEDEEKKTEIMVRHKKFSRVKPGAMGGLSNATGPVAHGVANVFSRATLSHINEEKNQPVYPHSMVARVARLKPKVTSDHARASIDAPAPWEPWDTDEHIRPPPEYHARTRPVSASMGRKCPPPKNNDRQTQPRTGTIRGLPYHAKEIRTMGLRPRPMSASMRRAALRSTRRGKVRPSSSTYLRVDGTKRAIYNLQHRQQGK